MNPWETALFVTLVGLILSNIFWAYFLFDQSISYTDLLDSYEEKSRTVSALGSLIVKGSDQYSKQDLLHVLRQSKPEAFIVDEGDTIVFEQIRFTFSDGTLVKVQ
jgi:hypothetical protein